MDARKKVYRINPPADEKLRAKLEEMRKDFHLLGAALETDEIIISLDETIR